MFDIDVFFEGEYYPMTAEIYSYGFYQTDTDEEGTWYDIEEEPKFNCVYLLDEDGNQLKGYGDLDNYLNDNPDDKLAVVAREMLREIYWSKTL